MPYGSPWSEAFICDLADKAFRDEFVADQIRTRIALLIRALREQEDRDWSQSELGRQMGKPQSVISRLEDPDYGKLSVQTLLEVAAVFGLPLWIDIPEWEDWLLYIRNVPNSKTRRRSFDAARLITRASQRPDDSSKIVDFERVRQLLERDRLNRIEAIPPRPEVQQLIPALANANAEQPKIRLPYGQAEQVPA
jgi:transcriptional regulator with XRE-family HTH domain